RNDALHMLLDATDQSVGDADVERTSRPAGEDVDPVAAHRRRSCSTLEYAARWIPGTSPGMTRRAGFPLHLSSRHLLPGSRQQPGPALADRWIPVTSTGMTGASERRSEA